MTERAAGGARVVELIEAYDGEGRSYTCSFVAGPLPVASYQSTLSVAESGASSGTAAWSIQFEPDGRAVAEEQDSLFFLPVEFRVGAM